MTSFDLEKLLNIPEDQDREYKLGEGGLPKSLWETYSAMANASGGVIVLGIQEKDGQFTVKGILNVHRRKKEFWDVINNPGKVSQNLLEDKDVSEEIIHGKPVLKIRIPRATRRQRPIYINNNLLGGTYRRNFEGDYKCKPDEVKRMLADQADEPLDSRTFDDFTMEDLDGESLKQFRNRFSSFSPQHPWLTSDDVFLLEKLGGLRRTRHSSAIQLTAAGLLMFGKNEVIRDPTVFPRFHLDYQEKLSEDPYLRWDHRITPDGIWAGNIFQFFLRVIPRLTSDLSIPFKLESSLFRKDDTIVHEAVREALVNSLIHADFSGVGGIIVRKFKAKLEFSNPGSLLLPMDQVFRGGVSECRNKALQIMFQMIGCGEKAGSGISKILQGWKSQHWRTPLIEEQSQPERVQVSLPMVSLLPEESLQRLRGWIGPEFDRLSPLEIQALVTAEQEGRVSNPRLQMMAEDHPADISKTLQNLASRNWLEKDGFGRWTSYSLRFKKVGFFEFNIVSASSELPCEGDSPHKDLNSQHNKGNLPHKTASLPHSAGDSQHNGENSQHNEGDLPRRTASLPHSVGDSQHNGMNSQHNESVLLKIADPVRKKQRITPSIMKKTIIALCKGRFLSLQQIARLLNRHPVGVRDRFLTPLVKEGELKLKYPYDPNRPDQAYQTTLSEEKKDERGDAGETKKSS